MKLLILFIIYFVLFYAIYKIYFWFKMKNVSELHKIMEIHMLEHKYKIKVEKIGIDKVVNLICLSNGIIFTIVLLGTMPIDNIILRLLLMFVLLIPLTYLVYTGIGKYLQRKGKKEND